MGNFTFLPGRLWWRPVAAVMSGALACSTAASARAATPLKAPFTVADSIQMTVLADPNARYARFNDSTVKRAPDGKHFFIVTRKGNLTTGTNDDALLLYDVEDIRRNLHKTTLPKPQELAHFASSSNREAIGRAHWLPDSRTIAFLGENPGETSQVYTVDIATRTIRKLTSHPTPILNFDLSATGERFIYMAVAPLDWSQRMARGFVVGTESIVDVEGKGHTSVTTRVAYYIGNKSGGAGRAVDLPPYDLQAIDFPWGMWVSPNDRWAVTLQHVPEIMPTAIARFTPDGAAAGTPADDNSSFVAPHPNIPLQYMLIDLDTGHGEPLIDAPTGLYIGGDELKAYWGGDGAYIVVSNTLLPYMNMQGEERTRRRTTPAIVEVNLVTRELRRIVDLTGSGKGRFVGSSMNSAGELVVNWSGAAKPSVYKRGDAGWSEVPAETTAAPSGGLQVALQQSVNQAPEIEATDPITGYRKIITDLNPLFRNLNLGTVETFEWQDTRGRKWTGGLLKPTSYRPGKRYPLVIQGHGYYNNIFLVDGADGCAAGCSARALANRDMVVVQMMDIMYRGPGATNEMDDAVAGYAALIDKLDKEGLVDRNRVGLHGWSRTGYYVQHALVFSDLKLAAASVADPSELSAWFYSMFYGVGDPGMLEIERMIGVPLWGDDNAKIWAERDPTFHLSHRQPVEYISLPDATHNPFKPWERQTSQQGTVDWYDFWLNGREDSDPQKADQYKRWHELKKWQESASKGAQQSSGK